MLIKENKTESWLAKTPFMYLVKYPKILETKSKHIQIWYGMRGGGVITSSKLLSVKDIFLLLSESYSSV